MILPFIDHRRTACRRPQKIHEHLDGIVYRAVGRLHRRNQITSDLKRQALEITDNSRTIGHLSDKKLYGKLRDFRRIFRRRKKGYETYTAQALAHLVELSDRTLGLRPFPVQIMGALALYRGYLAEMGTGEGKSLTACFPAVLAAWSGRPCHIVTVNDYLARRDAGEMKRFYLLCGLSTGCVTGTMDPEKRRENYAKGIVYTTSKEIVADFLRDRLVLGPYTDSSRRLVHKTLFPGWGGPDRLVMRGLDTVIVDEADSVLIDEAVTPLIISKEIKNKYLQGICSQAAQIGSQLQPASDYAMDIKYREVHFTSSGMEKIHSLSHALPGIWKAGGRSIESVKQAITAREFFKRDKHYIVVDDKIVIVDEFTGRMMPNRSWSQGLHQAVEAKEGLDVTSPNETLARLSFQKFFRLFRKLSGMTGTARSAADEFWHIYGLPVISIPTNRPCRRKELKSRIFPDQESKYRAVVREIQKNSMAGRPVLAGTRSVHASEKLAMILNRQGIDFNLLNAVHHEAEAMIVASAGEPGRVTIATNMAGRGTDIKLGKGVDEQGGLHVISTEKHESRRVDQQLAGRCARQGDRGSTRAYFSLDDELFLKFTRPAIRKRLQFMTRRRVPGAGRIAETAMASAQKKAQRLAFKQRKSVLKTDAWLDESLAFSGSEKI